MVERWENRQPTESTTSAASSASCVARRLGRTPCQSGSVSAIAPRPMTDVMTGAPEPTCERLELARRVRRDGAAPGDEEGSLGPREVPRRLLDQPDIARRPSPGASRREPGRHRRVEDVRRDRERDRSGPAGPEEVEGALDRPGNLRAAAQGVGPPADRPEALDLVRHLVERAHVLTDQGRGNVRHHEEHGLGARLGLDERRQRIGRARPGRDDDDARPARGPGIAVGHEAGALLVPRQDVADPCPAGEGRRRWRGCGPPGCRRRVARPRPRARPPPTRPRSGGSCRSSHDRRVARDRSDSRGHDASKRTGRPTRASRQGDTAAQAAGGFTSPRCARMESDAPRRDDDR